VLLGIVAGLFTFLRERSPGQGQFHPDDSFVAITLDGKLEVRDAEGKLLRLLREDLSEDTRSGRQVTIAVTADGRYAYHDAARTICKGMSIRAIARVDLVRGVSQLWVIGESPAVSPDGRKLAFLTDSYDGKEPFATLIGERPECADQQGRPAGGMLVVRDQGSKTELRWTGDEGPLAAPRFLRDNRQLFVQRGSDGVVIDTTQGEIELDDLEPLNTGDLMPTQFLPRGRMLMYACDLQSCRFSVTRMDDRPRSIAVLRGYGEDLRTVQLNPTGTRLLAGWSSDEGSVLVSYVLDGDRTTMLSEDVVAAAWLPN
jgi:hypothetical protein